MLRGVVYSPANLHSCGDNRRGETQACLVCSVPFRYLLHELNSTIGSVYEVERVWLRPRVYRLVRLWEDGLFFVFEVGLGGG